MVELDNDEMPVGLPGADTPEASAIRFTPLHGGGVAFELFDEAGGPLAFVLVPPGLLGKVSERLTKAAAMAAACSGEGLAGMAPEGTA